MGKCPHSIDERQIAFYHGACVMCLEAKIIELEADNHNLRQAIKHETFTGVNFAQSIEKLQQRIFELEEGIEKFSKNIYEQPMTDCLRELYKLIEK